MKNPVQIPRDNLVVYGLGGAFHWFHEIFMHRLGYRPDYLIDRGVRDGEHCEGIPTHRDLSAQIDVAHRHRYTVVVCTGKQETFAQIRAQLVDEQFENIVWIHELYEIHDPLGLSQDTFANPDAARTDSIAAARALFQDELSWEVFDSFIETHRTKIPCPIPQSPPETQYFPRDIGEEIPLQRIVMCGGDHDTLIRLAGREEAPVDSIVIFEPDPRGYRKFSNSENIKNWVGDIRKTARSLIVSPCAISAETGIAPFASAVTTFGSRLHAEGTNTVQRTTLDQSLHGIEPTYICADIEGEEFNMLHGARRIIESSGTCFAISVYHDASHVWQIPNMLHRSNPKYRFYLRNYTGFCSETILYAICGKTSPALPA